MKYRIVLLMLASIIALVLIMVLHNICLKQNLNIGNFSRTYIHPQLKSVNNINLPDEVYKFVGISDDYLFLTSGGLNKIFKLNLKSRKIQKIIENSHRDHNSNIIENKLYSFDPHLKKMFVYSIPELNLINEVNINIGFDRAIAVNDSIILLRSATQKYTKMNFSKFNLKTETLQKLKIQLNDSIEVDAGLKTDGYFEYKDSIIIYTQFKKGNFYKFNTSFDKISHYTTLDNIQNVEGVKVSSDSTFYFEKPVLNINLLTRINKDKLYIMSFVKGANDKLSDFTKYRTIDIYNLDTGNYLNSFHLPSNGAEKAIDFYFENNNLFLLFKKKLLVYEIN